MIFLGNLRFQVEVLFAASKIQVCKITAIKTMATPLQEIRKKMRENPPEPEDLDTNPKVVARRLKRLYELQTKLTAGDDIARRDLKNALTVLEWEGYENINEFNNSCEQCVERPAELNYYLEYLRKGDFFHNRAEKTKVTTKSKRDHRVRTGSLRLYHQAEGQYEEAIMYHLPIYPKCHV